MANMENVFKLLETLNPDELLQVQNYINKRNETLRVWAVNPQAIEALESTFAPIRKQAESLSDDEIDAAIDEALDEVRREQRS